MNRFLPLALAAALLAGCATVTNPVTGQKELTVMDERSEIAEGRKAHEEVLKGYGVYPNPRLQAYVNELGQRLAKQSHRQNLAWHFTVLDSPEINAFALPGGYVYVTRGLMAYMESEADLAGVIGHEIGHVTARHGAQEQFAADTARAEGRNPPASAGWLASHPSNDKRLQDIVQFSAQYKSKYVDEGRARYLQAIDGMTFGESREQGVTRGRHFYHEPLGIALTAPEGWKVRNTHEAVALVNAAGDAGLIVHVVPPKAGNSHEEVVRNVFKLEQGRTERLALGGFPATHFAGIARNRQGQAQAVEATVATGPANRHFLLFYGAKDAPALQRARGRMREAESSFRALTAADRAAARPWVLRTVAYQRGGFPQLARQSPLSGNAESQLRLINGVYAGGEPAAGQRVKVVE